jgi:hypothetical protein
LRILIVGLNYAPEPIGIGLQARLYATRELRGKGSLEEFKM